MNNLDDESDFVNRKFTAKFPRLEKRGGLYQILAVEDQTVTWWSKIDRSELEPKQNNFDDEGDFVNRQFTAKFPIF